ncbi:MAG: response regulator transcription factor [Rhodocyclaceae bacterium]|nr:response regulator transcription factor [Zoogloeaceae bacterium]MCP5255809.1 response regulator transcription factor [Zoogloeaceae bacterium]MCW5615454.1 response regulator transcription factor [Rhodocyclaceae bacterium]
MIKVLVADDHAVVRTGLKQFFASTDDIEIVAEARTGEEALSLARKDNCDVVLLDIGLPDINGLEVLKRIRAARPQVPVLIFSMFSEDEFATSALGAGAAGFLNKDSPPAQILSAVRTAASGARFLSPELAEKLLAGAMPGGRKLPHERLSGREMEVLLLLSKGTSLTTIAERLHLSVKTISTYRTRILDKMGISSNAEMTRYVIEHKLG